MIIPAILLLLTTIQPGVDGWHSNYKYAHKHFNHWSVNLMGYERNANGKYPTVIGKKYGLIFLACEVNKIKPTNIRWLRNDVPITFPPPYYLPWKRGSVLMVRPLIYGRTDGLYECIASNGYVTLRKGVNVTIREAHQLPPGFPHITTHPRHVRTLRNEVDFHCIVTGKPPIRILWFHNRVPLSDSSAYNVSPTTNTEGNKFSSNLMLMNVTKQTKGFYQCIAINSIGQTVSKQANIRFGGERGVHHKRRVRSVGGECPLPTPTSGLKQFHVDVTATCSSKRTRVVYLDIRWTHMIQWEGDVKHYLLSFHTGSTQPPFCRHVDVAKKSYRFDDHTISDTLYNITVFALSHNNTILGKGSLVTKRCPDDIVTRTIPPMQEKEVGSNHTIRCEYDGSPTPTRIHWFFTKDVAYCRGSRYLDVYVGRHVVISADKLEVTLIDITKEQAGCYSCEVENDFTKSESKSYLRVSPKKRKVGDKFTPFLVGAIGGVLFALVSFYVLYRYCVKHKQEPPVIPPVLDSKHSVYISHCVQNGKSRTRLLQFADLLQRECGIEVILDMTSISSINAAGGMCRWLPREMGRATKLMVYLTKEYLQVLNEKKKGGCDHDMEMSTKIHNELRVISNEVYEKCNKTGRILVVVDEGVKGVKADDFPIPLNGRTAYPFPQHMTVCDEEVKRIVGILIGEEAVQLAV